MTLGVAVEYLDIATLVVATGEGDDTLQVDPSAAVVTTPVMFDGGTGSDLLQIKDAPTPTTFDLQIYSPGPAVTEGRLQYRYDDPNTPGSDWMVIDFANLEPIQDNVPVAILQVNGTGADNAIDYVQGPNSGVAVSLFGGARRVWCRSMRSRRSSSPARVRWSSTPAVATM